jgi:hypothetical protein
MTFAPFPPLPAADNDRWREEACPIAVGSIAVAIPALVATAYASAGQRSRTLGSNLRLPHHVCTQEMAGRNLTKFTRLTRSAGRIWGSR